MLVAGDWIKFRSELWTHPKFIALVNGLLNDEECHGLHTYACGDLGLDVYPRSPKNVTELALQRVTEQALREVTMSALLRVWCMVNSHGKVDGSDAICAPMSLTNLDGIAGFDGFGYALEAVGWVTWDESKSSLIFKNFLEFNEPACLRMAPAMTNAERQAKYREKRRVTESNESNAREEKRRDTTPITPSGAFLKFWSAWPKGQRKQAQGKCWNIWRRSDFDQQAPAILSHVEVLKASEDWRRDAGRFVPAPLVYLNQRRWEGAEQADPQERTVAL